MSMPATLDTLASIVKLAASVERRNHADAALPCRLWFRSQPDGFRQLADGRLHGAGAVPGAIV
jgi:hypothetical protein